jgi:hypothetical protein
LKVQNKYEPKNNYKKDIKPNFKPINKEELIEKIKNQATGPYFIQLFKLPENYEKEQITNFYKDIEIKQIK